MISYFCIVTICERYRNRNLTAPVSRWLLSPSVEHWGLFYAMGKYVDIKGQRFGRLVALEYLGSSKWKCKCDCGKITNTASYYSLISGATTSCGCYHREVLTGRVPTNKTHGMRCTPEFNIWSMMKNRCTNPNCNRHQFYKDKGIKVCDRWLGTEGFAHFIEDMGMRPGPEYSVDRIDNNGDYCPENCRWATKKEQSNNQSRNILIEYKGKTQTLALWCDELGLNYKRVWRRLKDGASVEAAFFEPLKERMLTEDEVKAIRKYHLTKGSFEKMFGHRIDTGVICNVKNYKTYKDIV